MTEPFENPQAIYYRLGMLEGEVKMWCNRVNRPKDDDWRGNRCK